MRASEFTLELIRRGYFPNSLTPPFTVQNLGLAYRDILAYLRPLRARKPRRPNYPRAMTVRHSVPKRKLSRRVFSIPNPIHHVLVSREVARHWRELDALCAASPIALSRPILGFDRAIEAKFTRSAQALERAIRSVGKRYVLKADFSRYYPSIYTHAIPMGDSRQRKGSSGLLALWQSTR